MTTENTENITPIIEAPPRPPIPFFQKWRSFGTGLGIEVTAENLLLAITVVRPSGIRILDAFEVLRYRERPAAEWGADVLAFLAKHKLSYLSATVVLPANDCIARCIALPGVADSELDAALRYQLDGLHPFAEEEVAYSFARLQAPRKSCLSVAVARNPVIEDYANLFDEAGIGVASFLSPAAAIYSAIRTLQPPPAEQFMAVHEDEAGLLLYAETTTHPIYSVRFPASNDRAIAASASQIRLPEDAPMSKLAALLPPAERLDIASTFAFAASLSAALPKLSLPINLLPQARRRTISPWRWVPTIILMVLLAILGLGYAYYQDYENQRLLNRLDAEIAKLQPRIKSVKALEANIALSQSKLQAISVQAGYPQQDLDTIRELTRVMPVNAYVQRMDLTRNEIALIGEVDQAMELLKTLDSSPFFKDSEFTSPPGRSQNGKEVFQIRAKREFPGLATPAPAQQPQPPRTPR